MGLVHETSINLLEREERKKSVLINHALFTLQRWRVASDVSVFKPTQRHLPENSFIEGCHVTI